MSDRKLDENTAASELEDADFAGEHTRPTFSDEPGPDAPDESVPSGKSGMDDPEHDEES